MNTKFNSSLIIGVVGIIIFIISYSLLSYYSILLHGAPYLGHPRFEFAMTTFGMSLGLLLALLGFTLTYSIKNKKDYTAKNAKNGITRNGSILKVIFGISVLIIGIYIYVLLTICILFADLCLGYISIILIPLGTFNIIEGKRKLNWTKKNLEPPSKRQETEIIWKEDKGNL